MVFGASRKGKQMKKCAQDGCNAKVWEHEKCVRHRPEDPKIVERRNARRKDPATKTKSNRECPSCWQTNGHDKFCTRKRRTEAA
jgi:hypothetical protein